MQNISILLSPIVISSLIRSLIACFRTGDVMEKVTLHTVITSIDLEIGRVYRPQATQALPGTGC